MIDSLLKDRCGKRTPLGGQLQAEITLRLKAVAPNYDLMGFVAIMKTRWATSIVSCRLSNHCSFSASNLDALPCPYLSGPIWGHQAKYGDSPTAQSGSSSRSCEGGGLRFWSAYRLRPELIH